MLKRAIVIAGLLVMAGVVPAFAQKVEVSGFVGWSITDGVDSDPVLAGDGNIYDTVEPNDSAIYGFTVGVARRRGRRSWLQVGTAANDSQASKERIEREIGDMNITSYHGYFAYNFGEVDAPMRPFVLIGLGATNLRLRGRDHRRSESKPRWRDAVLDHLGRRREDARSGRRSAPGAEWTPTYIKTDSAGWWCDPYWGCYLVGNPSIPINSSSMPA